MNQHGSAAANEAQDGSAVSARSAFSPAANSRYSSCARNAQVPPLREALTRGVDWAAVAAQQRISVFGPGAVRPSAARLKRLLAAVEEPDVSSVLTDLHAQVIPPVRDWQLAASVSAHAECQFPQRVGNAPT